MELGVRGLGAWISGLGLAVRELFFLRPNNQIRAYTLNPKPLGFRVKGIIVIHWGQNWGGDKGLGVEG